MIDDKLREVLNNNLIETGNIEPYFSIEKAITEIKQAVLDELPEIIDFPDFDECYDENRYEQYIKESEKVHEVVGYNKAIDEIEKIFENKERV